MIGEVRVNVPAWRKLGHLAPAWRDENGDGQDELVFRVRKWSPTVLGPGLKSEQTVAVFKPSPSGGALEAVSLPGDGSIRVVTPSREGAYAIPGGG